MVFPRKTRLRRCLKLSAILALLVFISSLWLPQVGNKDCGNTWQPCLSFYHQTSEHPPAALKWVGSDEDPPTIKDCPGQEFQARLLLMYLRSSLSKSGDDEDDVLLEPYLQSWDQLLSFMNSLGTMVSFFSQKVKKKVTLVQELSLKHAAEADGKNNAQHSALQKVSSSGLNRGAFRSIRSMVEAELKAGVVNFSQRTDSGCRTLLRLHRSLLWLKLMLEGLAGGPDADGRYKTPGELSRDAYKVALAPYHHWVLRQAAELVFIALPDRQYFLQLVCAQHQEEATPIMNIIIQALTVVHQRTQHILAQHNMLELP